MKDVAPAAWHVLLELCGGAERVVDGGEGLVLGASGHGFHNGVAANLCKDRDLPWEPPHAEMNGWHCVSAQTALLRFPAALLMLRRWQDGWHYRHFLDSPEQGLVCVPLFSDILPRSGGTHVSPDSIGVFARFLATLPQGIHADMTQGECPSLMRQLVRQCSRFEELTGSAGDM